MRDEIWGIFSSKAKSLLCKPNLNNNCILYLTEFLKLLVILKVKVDSPSENPVTNQRLKLFDDPISG